MFCSAKLVEDMLKQLVDLLKKLPIWIVLILIIDFFCNVRHGDRIENSASLLDLIILKQGMLDFIL